MMIIPYNLLFIWLGNDIPQTTLFAIDAFKAANPSFAVKFFQHKIQEINNSDNALLIQSANIILSNSKEWQPFIQNQLYIYGKNIRFIQLLSDVYRIVISCNFGGIYVDCDAFPIKPFDENLLSSPFCVMSHQNGSLAPAVDNYFFGLPKGYSLQRCIADGNINLTTQTYVHWQADINYIMRKKKFKECKLSSNDFSKDSSFYIEHYPSSNWKLHPEKIPLCKYDFCEEFIKLKNAFAN